MDLMKLNTHWHCIYKHIYKHSVLTNIQPPDVLQRTGAIFSTEDVHILPHTTTAVLVPWPWQQQSTTDVVMIRLIMAFVSMSFHCLPLAAGDGGHSGKRDRGSASSFHNGGFIDIAIMVRCRQWQAMYHGVRCSACCYCVMVTPHSDTRPLIAFSLFPWDICNKIKCIHELVRKCSVNIWVSVGHNTFKNNRDTAQHKLHNIHV
jgi:hypothetical protein